MDKELIKNIWRYGVILFDFNKVFPNGFLRVLNCKYENKVFVIVLFNGKVEEFKELS